MAFNFTSERYRILFNSKSLNLSYFSFGMAFSFCAVAFVFFFVACFIVEIPLVIILMKIYRFHLNTQRSDHFIEAFLCSTRICVFKFNSFYFQDVLYIRKSNVIFILYQQPHQIFLRPFRVAEWIFNPLAFKKAIEDDVNSPFALKKYKYRNS